MRIALCVMLAACRAGEPVTGGDAPTGDPTFTLRELGRVPLAEATDLAIANGRLYVKLQPAGGPLMAIFDLTDPAVPAFVGNLLPPSNVSGATSRLAIVGDHAYLAHESDGLLIADISDPANPSVVGQFTMNTYPKDVVVRDQRAYLADQDSGLVIVDVGIATSPQLLGNAATDSPFGIALSGDLAFLADNTGGLAIVDVANPFAPQVVGSDPALEELRTIATHGTIAFAIRSSAPGEDGLVVIDATAPATPIVTLREADPNLADVFVDGDHLLLISDRIDVRTATAMPTPVTSLALGQQLQLVVASPTHLYVTTETELIVVEKVFP